MVSLALWCWVTFRATQNRGIFLAGSCRGQAARRLLRSLVIGRTAQSSGFLPLAGQIPTPPSLCSRRETWVSNPCLPPKRGTHLTSVVLSNAGRPGDHADPFSSFSSSAHVCAGSAEVPVLWFWVPGPLWLLVAPLGHTPLAPAYPTFPAYSASLTAWGAFVEMVGGDSVKGRSWEALPGRESAAFLGTSVTAARMRPN